MHEQRDLTPQDADAVEPAPQPVRRVDEHRWLASWERFQSAHDEHDANDVPLGTATARPVDEPVPRAAPATAAADPARPQSAVPPAERAKARARAAKASPAAVAASASDLTSQTLLRPRDETPTRGWRRLLHRASGGGINLGPSAGEQRHRELLRRIAVPVQGCHRIAVVSLKGGIGKTTTTAGLGLTLAQHRGDRVVALDANPDAGTLAERLTVQPSKTVRDLLANLDGLRSFADMSSYTAMSERLAVLASDQDPELSRAFDEQSYRAVAEVLARFFTIVLTDSGTGLLHSAMVGTLDLADSLVVVGAPSVDGASRAAKTLDWLVAHGHRDLVGRSVAVINSVRPGNSGLDVDVLRTHFAGRCRSVVEIPYDPHLATGGRIDPADLGRPTSAAFVALAAAVADGFPRR